MKKCCICNCCNHLCWFCFLFSAEELGALKTTLNDWQHHQQLETLTLEAVTSQADPQLFGRQPDADSRRQTTMHREPADMGLTHLSRQVNPLIHPMQPPGTQCTHPTNGLPPELSKCPVYWPYFLIKSVNLSMPWHFAMSFPSENTKASGTKL